MTKAHVYLTNPNMFIYIIDSSKLQPFANMKSKYLPKTGN